MANPKKIGDRNERMCANFFKWWTGWDFHRVPASGGLHWKKDKRVAGDLVCPEDHIDEFPFCIETKTRRPKVGKKSKKVYEQINLGKLIIDWNDCRLMEFWEQCSDDAVRVGREPMMLIRNAGMNKNLFYVFLEDDIGMLLERRIGLCGMRIKELKLFITTTFELEEHKALDMFKLVMEESKRV